ncbi:MAG: pyridoxal phosphate-dependent aminotransferase, partial [Candidatus Woesearchaeota archaeon]|nr:pyridoxal phosphate-dependent aminotransferase [Candidatus Woesearchaeota archaeon]
PSGIIKLATDSLARGNSYEGMSRGIPALREILISRETELLKADCYAKCYTAKNIVVCPGSIAGLAAAILATCDPSDEILVADPGWEIHKTQAELLGVSTVNYPLSEDKSWAPNLEQLAKLVTPKTKAIILSSPSNPTGGVIDQGSLLKIAKILAERSSNAYIISDEVYKGISFVPCCSALALPEKYLPKVITVSSFSKAHSMPGWRFGYVVADAPVAAMLEKVARNLWITTPSFIQRAILGVSEEGVKTEVESMRREYETRRDIVLNALTVANISCVVPQGSFYAFPRVNCSSVALANFLLEKHSVAVVPGLCFGSLGEEHIRLSFGKIATNELPDAMSKLIEGIKQYNVQCQKE